MGIRIRWITALLTTLALICALLMTTIGGVFPAARGNGLAYDLGDAPDSYGTLLASDGARHIQDLGVMLNLGGAPVPDIDLDGQPNATATGDDIAGVNDENGVTFGPIIVDPTMDSLASVVANRGGSYAGPAYLSAWLDFNHDGDWNDTGEQIIANIAVVAGNNTLTFTVPKTAGLGTSFARFRISTVAQLLSSGAAPNGEVEDHLVTLTLGTPALSLHKSVSPTGAVLPGARLTYTLSFSNTGTAATSPDTVVTDVLDGWLDEATLSDIGGWGGTYNHTNRTITWLTGSISPGGSWGVTFSVNVRSIQNVFLLIRNTGLYSATTGGTGHSNTVETPVLPIVLSPEEEPVIPPPPPSIAIDVTAQDPLCVGVYLPYRICFTNGVQPYTYTVDFGDGTPIITGTTSSSCVTLEHAFLEVRQYGIYITVRDSKGMQSTYRETFTIKDCATKLVVYHHNFFIGYPDGTFQPEGNITRAEMAAAMSRALGLGWTLNQSGFSDVKPDHWAAGHITLMQRQGFMLGDTGGTFRPDAPITRAEAAAVFLRIAGMSPIVNLPSSSFSDVQPTYWAAGYIEAGRQAGLLAGYPDNTFKPTDFLSRAEYATLASDTLGREPTNTNPWESPECAVQFPDVTRAFWAYNYIVEVSTPHTVTNPTRVTRVISLKEHDIPLYTEGAKGIITFLHVGDTITAIVPVDGIRPDGSDPVPRKVIVCIIDRDRP